MIFLVSAWLSVPHTHAPKKSVNLLVDRNCEAKSTTSQCCACKKAVCMDENTIGEATYCADDTASCCAGHESVCNSNANNECTTGADAVAWSDAHTMNAFVSINGKWQCNDHGSISSVGECCECKREQCKAECDVGGTCADSSDGCTACCTAKKEVCYSEGAKDLGTCAGFSHTA